MYNRFAAITIGRLAVQQAQDRRLPFPSGTVHAQVPSPICTSRRFGNQYL